MFSSILSYLVSHRSAILATLVIVQNTHVFKGVGSSVLSALIALGGG